MELERDSFPKGLKLHCKSAYSCFNRLAFQPFWEFKPFEKQLSFEKQIKLAIKLNLEFMKQNEREREAAHLNE